MSCLVQLLLYALNLLTNEAILTTLSSSTLTRKASYPMIFVTVLGLEVEDEHDIKPFFLP